MPKEDQPLFSGTGGELTLVGRTESGRFTRVVPAAMPLRADVQPGTATEMAVQAAAAVWGLPDFFLRPSVESRRSKNRELGDGLLVVKDRGIVLQAKGRNVAPADPAREQAWIEKQIETALGQARGTVRRLRRSPATFRNGRGRNITIDGNSYNWVAVIVLEHPDPPEGFIPALGSDPDLPAVVLLRRDWEFLFDQLKSTYAVAQYLTRVADTECWLGHEPVRYYELANDDYNTAPGDLDPALLASGTPISAPLLPRAPASDDDRDAFMLYRSILEDIAASPGLNDDEPGRLRILAELDRLPVSHRSEMGRHLLDGLNAMAKVAPGVTEWRFRRIVGAPGAAHLALGVASRFSHEHQEMFRWWAQLRHYDRQLQTGETELVTVAVLLTLRDGGVRKWDTTMTAVAGPIEFEDDELAALREAWGYPGQPGSWHT